MIQEEATVELLKTHCFEQRRRAGVVAQEGEDRPAEVVVQQMVLVPDREELNRARGCVSVSARE